MVIDRILLDVVKNFSTVITLFSSCVVGMLSCAKNDPNFARGSSMKIIKVIIMTIIVSWCHCF